MTGDATHTDGDAALIDDLDHLEVWRLREPPEDFAPAVQRSHAARGHEAPTRVEDRVAARDLDAPPHGRRRRWAVLAATGLAAAAVVAAAVARPWASPESGALNPAGRQTVELGSRAVVVAEAQADLSWVVDVDGAARVEQAAGSAFYRVDSGPAFVVHTPAGTVEVTGTSFKVEVEAMEHNKQRKRIGAVAVGALLTAAVAVTVYEGRVVLANDHGEVDVDAGESAVATDRARPRSAEPDADARPTVAAQVPGGAVEELRNQNRAQRRTIERLEAQLDEGGADADADAEGDGPDRIWGPGSPPRPEGFDHFEPTQAALEQMARCGIVAWDSPDLQGSVAMRAEALEAADVSDAERAALEQVRQAFHAEKTQRLREYYEALGGAAQMAEKMTPGELLQVVYGRLGQASVVPTREAIAREKAGLAQPPPEDQRTVADEFMRWEADLGNAFQDQLADAIGTDRAYELRAAGGGWASQRSSWTNRCAKD